MGETYDAVSNLKPDAARCLATCCARLSRSSKSRSNSKTKSTDALLRLLPLACSTMLRLWGNGFNQ